MMRCRHMGALIVVAGLLAGCGEEGKKPLLCYVGGTMRPALEELAKAYQAETGQAVDLDYNDSGALLITIKETRKGDLYVCHDPFAGSLEKQSLARQIWTVATLTPTIAVPKGNPKGIRGLADLAKPGIRLGLTDEAYSTLGHICPVIFRRANLRPEIEANVKARERMGGAIANKLMLGHFDAVIVWNAVIFARREKLDAVPIEADYLPDPRVDAVTTATFGPIDMSTVKVTIATLGCSKQPEAAAAFAEFVNSPRGRKVFADRGFSPAPASPTASTTPAPSKAGRLYLYCGAGLRKATDEAIHAFTADTGVTVEADYSGSETLLASLKLSRTGDLYMPGDVHYVDEAAKEGLIASQRDVCYFVPVILVQKGNPKGIRALADLTREGIKIGLGDPKAAAIGRLCEKIFAKNNIAPEAIQKNLAYSGPTVNVLGVQIQTGHLDAVIVWGAIAAQFADSGDVVPIPADQNIISHVAIGVLESAKDPVLANRFVDFLASGRGKAIFQKHHYTTQLPEK